MARTQEPTTIAPPAVWSMLPDIASPTTMTAAAATSTRLARSNASTPWSYHYVRYDGHHKQGRARVDPRGVRAGCGQAERSVKLAFDDPFGLP